MKVTISRIVRGDKDTKFGTKNSVGLKIQETTISDVNGNEVEVNDRWLNCLYDLNRQNGTEAWNDGDSVDIDVTVNGEYLNFRPSSADSVRASNNLEERVKKIEEHLGFNKDNVVEEPDNF